LEWLTLVLLVELPEVCEHSYISSLLGLNERCCCPFAVVVSFGDPTLLLALFCRPRGMAMLLFWCCPVLAVFVVAYLPLNVSHCWSPLLFVSAVPSLLKGSSIIVALVPMSARPFWDHFSVFITDFYNYFSGMLLAFGRLIVLCEYSG
jgi:hypothetical protein